MATQQQQSTDLMTQANDAITKFSKDLAQPNTNLQRITDKLSGVADKIKEFSIDGGKQVDVINSQIAQVRAQAKQSKDNAAQKVINALKTINLGELNNTIQKIGLVSNQIKANSVLNKDDIKGVIQILKSDKVDNSTARGYFGGLIGPNGLMNDQEFNTAWNTIVAKGGKIKKNTRKRRRRRKGTR